MKQNGNSFVICVESGGYRVSLQLRKVYQTLPDAFAEEHVMIRVIDETDEDYLFPAAWFVPIKLPPAARKIFPAHPQSTLASRPAG